MKRLICLIFLGVCLHITAIAQEVETGVLREDSLVATTVWANTSSTISTMTTPKWVEILNDGAVTLYYALDDDTLSNHFQRLKTGSPGERRYFSRIKKVSKIRLRAASGTCALRIRWGYPKP